MGLFVDVAVVGGGPGGLAAAKSILTARPDLKVAVLERSSNLAAPRGASLGLLPNGFRALQAIDPALREAALRLDAKHLSKRVCNRAGAVIFEESGADVGATTRQFGDLAHMGWHDLRLMLSESLPQGVIQPGLGFERYEEAEGGLRVHLKQLGAGAGQGGSQEAQVVTTKVLVGCDGNQSGVRAQLLGDGPPSFMGTVIWRAVLPECPPCWNAAVPAQRSWFGMADGRAFSAFSLPGGRLSLLAVAPWPHERLSELADASYIHEPAARAEQAAAVKRRCLEAFAEGWPAEVTELLAAMDPQRLTEHGQFYREPAACGEWGRGRVTLLGDAAHLATPFLAQGTSQALEDALELGRAIHELGPTPEALRRYEAVRQPLNAPVHEASVELFRDFVAGRARQDGELAANIKGGFLSRTFEPLPRLAGAACV